jgi:hypothetical protein
MQKASILNIYKVRFTARNLLKAIPKLSALCTQGFLRQTVYTLER